MSSKKRRSKLPLISEEKFKGLERYALIGCILLSIFLLGGGIYDLKYRPAGVVYDDYGNMYSVYPGYDGQTLNESLTVMVLYGLGILGLFLCYKGTEVMYDRNRANLFFSGGLLLIFIGILGNYQLLNLKFSYFEDLLSFIKQLFMIN
ncbi:hypothetical protein JW865_02510 [Candidatus Bathyarchaeota archaeon]|nr:hypothetical protein [Candidatus Bathyarchaeota archaeon]